MSSYDDPPTPGSGSDHEIYSEHILEQVKGPSGPHLFRGSAETLETDRDYVLSLSPITPKPLDAIDDLLDGLFVARRSSPFQYTNVELDSSTLVSWTPEMVAQSMLNAGIELCVADQFVQNDIDGAILMTLKFEDLRELGIQSFGIRTQVWHQIQALQNVRSASPRPPTPIEDTPSQEVCGETHKNVDRPKGRQVSKKRPRRKPSSNQDTIHPMESVSIIGIEQVIPKPHHCSKGANCSKWKKQQRAMEDLKRWHPTIDLTAGGKVLIYGDAGNPETARAIDPDDALRPSSDAAQSVVASSDIMGPGGMTLLQYIQETAAQSVTARGPQDSIRQFLSFQQHTGSDQVPPTPPFEITRLPHHGLRRLPKLSIPREERTAPRLAESLKQKQTQRQSTQQILGPSTQSADFLPYGRDRVTTPSPAWETSKSFSCRIGTPFSELDVPVTAVPIGPVARDVSQSVPPDMNYRTSPTTKQASPSRSQSRASTCRPSVSVLPVVDETKVASSCPSERPFLEARTQQQPLHAPPRFNYPWSPTDRTRLEHAIPPLSTFRPDTFQDTPLAVKGVSYQGPMKKRKTRLLRHEWQDGFFTLKGTRLNMHKDVQDIDRTLEYVDIDDYAIACSSLASTSKLRAAFKAVRISHNREKSDPVGAFSFQLIPQEKPTGARLRKRESSMGSGNNSYQVSFEGSNGTGKIHHFAVTSRDDRIDWMRELMLAKAMKQKGDGFELSVNGNMI